MSDNKKKKEAPQRLPTFTEWNDASRRDFVAKRVEHLRTTAVQLQLETPEQVEERFRMLLGEAIPEEHEFSVADDDWFREIADFVCKELAELKVAEIAISADLREFNKAISALKDELPAPTRSMGYHIWSFNYNQDTAFAANINAKKLVDAFGYLNAAGLCGRPFVTLPSFTCIEVKVGHLKHHW